MNIPADPGRILSIQSHVVSGYVGKCCMVDSPDLSDTTGNRAATFPLQLLGYDVDVVNTVQFSNHTGKLSAHGVHGRELNKGYGFTDGVKTTPEQLQSIFNGLIVNGLTSHSRALTGYIPGAEALKAVFNFISRLKQENPELIYVLDRE